MTESVKWQPIDSAPTDGTAILLTDGHHLAAGARVVWIEPDWKYFGYDESLKIGARFTEKIPNPNAGKRYEWWNMFGCSGFNSDVDVDDVDGPISFSPTHWMPLPSPPMYNYKASGQVEVAAGQTKTSWLASPSAANGAGGQ